MDHVDVMLKRCNHMKRAANAMKAMSVAASMLLAGCVSLTAESRFPNTAIMTNILDASGYTDVMLGDKDLCMSGGYLIPARTFTATAAGGHVVAGKVCAVEYLFSPTEYIVMVRAPNA